LALRTCSLLLGSIPEPEHETNMKSVSCPVCLFGSNLMVNVCTRKGSRGGSCGFTGRKDENGTLTLQKPTFIFIRAKYFLLWDVSASRPVSRITTYDLPFPPTEKIKPSYLSRVEPRGRESLFDISTYPPLVKTNPEKMAGRSSENSNVASIPSSNLESLASVPYSLVINSG